MVRYEQDTRQHTAEGDQRSNKGTLPAEKEPRPDDGRKIQNSLKGMPVQANTIGKPAKESRMRQSLSIVRKSDKDK